MISVLEGLLSHLPIKEEGAPLINLLFTQALVQHLGLPNFGIGFLEAIEEGAFRREASCIRRVV